MDINRIELFRTGRWNNFKDFTTADLDGMVQAFDELKMAGRVPFKMGHNEAQPFTDGQPALGWLSKVYRDGDVLYGDATGVPSAVHAAIKDGLYKFVSVELAQWVMEGGSEYPFVLSAVALLGADIPAVKGLKDLQALTYAKAPKFGSSVAKVAFTLVHHQSGERRHMADEKTPDLAKVIAQVEDLSGKVATFTAENARLTAENRRLVEESEAKEKAAKAERVKNHRSAITQKFDDAINQKRIFASARNLFEKGPAFKSDESVLDIKLEDVDQYIKEQTVSGWKPTKFSDDQSQDTLGGTPDDKLPPDQQVARKVEAEVLKYGGKLSYSECTKRVLRANPELAESYRSQPGIKGGREAA
jgi:hypothetical protein